MVGESNKNVFLIQISALNLQILRYPILRYRVSTVCGTVLLFLLQAMSYSAGLSKASLPVQTLSDVNAKAKMDGLPPHCTLPHMAKLMSYSALWVGHLLSTVIIGVHVQGK